MQRFHHYYGDDFTIKCPTGSGNMVTIRAATKMASATSLFMKDVRGHRPFLGTNRTLQEDPHFQGLIQFNEYFDGETDEGAGPATRQDGPDWPRIIERYYGSGTDGGRGRAGPRRDRRSREARRRVSGRPARSTVLDLDSRPGPAGTQVGWLSG